MIACSVILSDVAATLQDEGMVTYTEAHLVAALNAACRVIAASRIDAAITTQVVSLAAGTRQALPASGQQFIGATRNIQANNAPGRAVQTKTVVDKNRICPEWHSQIEEDEVLEVMPDEHDPLVFWNYPPVKAGARLEIKFSTMPTPIASQAASFPLLDKYAEPAKHWVLFKMFSRDTNSPGHPAKAAMHKATAMELLGISTQADGAASARASA